MGTVVGNSLNGEARLICPALFNDRKFLTLLGVFPNPDYLYQLIIKHQLTQLNFNDFASRMPGINQRTGLPYNTSLNEEGRLRLDFEFDEADVTTVDRFKYIKSFMLLTNLSLSMESETLFNLGEQAIEHARLGEELKKLSNEMKTYIHPDRSLLSQYDSLMRQYDNSRPGSVSQAPSPVPKVHPQRDNQRAHQSQHQHHFFSHFIKKLTEENPSDDKKNQYSQSP